MMGTMLQDNGLSRGGQAVLYQDSSDRHTQNSLIDTQLNQQKEPDSVYQLRGSAPLRDSKAPLRLSYDDKHLLQVHAYRVLRQ